MANVSSAVEIETRTGRVLSIALQGVADDQSVNVGTLLKGIKFSVSAADTADAHYCHISCSTTEMLSLFPGEREKVLVERIGDAYVLNETTYTRPESQR